MKKAGVREARQNLSVLLEEVKKGRQIVITEHGRAVARLVPEPGDEGAAFGSHKAIRRRMPTLDPPLSQQIGEDRDDRL